MRHCYRQRKQYSFPNLADRIKILLFFWVLFWILGIQYNFRDISRGYLLPHFLAHTHNKTGVEICKGGTIFQYNSTQWWGNHIRPISHNANDMVPLGTISACRSGAIILVPLGAIILVPLPEPKMALPRVELDIWEWLHFWSQNGSIFVLCAPVRMHGVFSNCCKLRPKIPQFVAGYDQIFICYALPDTSVPLNSVRPWSVESLHCGSTDYRPRSFSEAGR